MSAEPLRATATARRLGLPTSELLRLIHDREIRYVLVNGIAHVPEDAISEYEVQVALAMEGDGYPLDNDALEGRDDPVDLTGIDLDDP